MPSPVENLVGPASAGSPEETYALASSARRTIRSLEEPPPDLLEDMAMVASELLHNAADHSQPAPDRPWAVHLLLQHRPGQRDYLLQVSDAGRGINAALNGEKSSSTDHDAVMNATQAGVTSSGDPDRGNGLDMVMQAALKPGRTLTINSASAFFMVHPDAKLELGLAPCYPGTRVTATFPYCSAPTRTGM